LFTRIEVNIKNVLSVKNDGVALDIAISFYFNLFAQKTTIIITMTKVPVHELDKKANKPVLTVAHNRP